MSRENLIVLPSDSQHSEELDIFKSSRVNGIVSYFVGLKLSEDVLNLHRKGLGFKDPITTKSIVKHHMKSGVVFGLDAETSNKFDKEFDINCLKKLLSSIYDYDFSKIAFLNGDGLRNMFLQFVKHDGVSIDTLTKGILILFDFNCI